MKNYRVLWEIELEAETPLAAAQEALEIHRDPDSIALVFRVIGPIKDETTIGPWDEVTIDLWDEGDAEEETPCQK